MSALNKSFADWLVEHQRLLAAAPQGALDDFMTDRDQTDRCGPRSTPLASPWHPLTS
nr:hypothetical protein [uncultured Thiodictyon sp.]